MSRPLVRIPSLELTPPMPRYYMPGEVKALLDAQRRRHRKNVIWLVIFQIFTAGPVRLAADSLLTNPRAASIAFVQPYVVPAMVVMVIMIWIFGIKMAFRRKGY